MNALSRYLSLGLFLALGGWTAPQLQAQEAPTPAAPVAPSPAATEAETTVVQVAEAADDAINVDARFRRFGKKGDAVVAIGDDAELAAGQSSDAVVAIFGSASSAGNVAESVVSILGNTRVSGTVGESAVAILGNVDVNGRVDKQVVAILGDVELGPEADIGDDVVVIGGSLKRDPAARVNGNVNNVAAGLKIGHVDWLDAWIDNCVVYLRPLALAPGLGWAWGVALAFLALYVALALLFRGSTEKCVATLETFPGRSLLAAFLSVLLKPIVYVLLFVTVVGIAVVPFLWMALFLVGLFGKMVVLAWLGRRGTRFFGEGPYRHPAFAVLLGGIVILALYLVPVLGLVVYKLLGILGFGVVLYTLLLAWQAEHRPAVAASATGSLQNAAGVDKADASAQTSPSGLGFEGPAASTSASTPEAPVAPQPAADSTGLPRAGFWIRMAALFIDALLFAIILAVIDSHGSALLLLLAAYGAVMWKVKSTTIGGSICGIKVVRLDGRPIDWPTAVVRALSCFLSLAVAGLGFIWVVFDAEKQSWHDKIAGTTIVRVPKGVSLL